MIGVFVTAFYSFRLLFMTFHGKPRWEAHGAAHRTRMPSRSATHADAATHPVIHAHRATTRTSACRAPF